MSSSYTGPINSALKNGLKHNYWHACKVCYLICEKNHCQMYQFTGGTIPSNFVIDFWPMLFIS